MLGCFLPVASSSSPFLSAEVRKEERDAAERAIVDTASADDIGDVVPPPPSNRAEPEIEMPFDMGREDKKIELHEENNPWTEPTPEDAAYEKTWDTEFPNPPGMAEMVAADEAEKHKERPDFMSKVFDQDRGGKNFAAAEKLAEDQDARVNAEDESLNGDTKMAGMNNALLAGDKAAKKEDAELNGGFYTGDAPQFPTRAPSDMSHMTPQAYQDQLQHSHALIR